MRAWWRSLPANVRWWIVFFEIAWLVQVVILVSLFTR